ncbi:hypothetical protein P7H12_07800 [Paenibacillus larvae]|nr:hypothetical protein [Paenibacillus larvae]MDT2263513.1 hypothetical protein [Paenibacillus larvae]
MEWKWDNGFLITGYVWVVLASLLLMPAVIAPVYVCNKSWDISRWNKEEQGKETNKRSFLTRFFMSPGIRSKTLNLIMKDLLLTTRGETISWEFIKKVWFSSSCMLGGFAAFSYHLTGKEQLSQGVLLLLVIISQMILAALATIAAGKVTSLDTERNWIILHFVRLENPYFLYRAKAILHFFSYSRSYVFILSSSYYLYRFPPGFGICTGKRVLYQLNLDFKLYSGKRLFS